MTLRRFGFILFSETKYEFLKLVRLPTYVVPTIAFPLMFYVIFGLTFRARGEAAATYMLANIGAFGVIGASLFGLGVGVAGERGQGWLSVKRASPMPLGAYFGAKVLMAMLFSAIIVCLLVVLGISIGHVQAPPSQLLSLGVELVLGAAPFCALGLAVGYIAGPNSAPAVVNLIYLPMSFASGLWMPIDMLPQFVKRIAPALPPFHLSRLALGAVQLDASPAMTHAAALVGFTLLFLLLASIGYARDEGRTYG